MKKSVRGFTLVELMVTLGVIAILAAVAAPAFEGLLNDAARRASLSAINGDVQFARGEALSKSQNVVICASSNGTTCSGSNTWDDGWIVFSDVNGNGAPNYGTNSCATTEDCLLKVDRGMTRGVTLRGNGSQLTFSELGELSGGATALSLCGNDAQSSGDSDKSHSLSVVGTGSMSVTKGTTTCP